MYWMYRTQDAERCITAEWRRGGALAPGPGAAVAPRLPDAEGRDGVGPDAQRGNKHTPQHARLRWGAVHGGDAIPRQCWLGLSFRDVRGENVLLKGICYLPWLSSRCMHQENRSRKVNVWGPKGRLCELMGNDCRCWWVLFGMSAID
jgi:hypothetical protein